MGNWKWRPVGDRSHDFRCDGKVVTLSDDPNKFYDEADILCLKCGQTGYLFVDGAEGVDFIWHKHRRGDDSDGGE